MTPVRITGLAILHSWDLPVRKLDALGYQPKRGQSNPCFPLFAVSRVFIYDGRCRVRRGLQVLGRFAKALNRD